MMPRNRLVPAAVIILLTTLTTSSGCNAGNARVAHQFSRPSGTTESSVQPTITAHPKEIEDILYNPGMGFADFHFGFDHPPTVPEQYPRSTVAYFRWPWAELEPEEGLYAFDLVDRVIAEAKKRGETLAFRIDTHYQAGTPKWLYAKGVDGVDLGGPKFPDYNNSIFLDHHEKLLKAFGARYDGSPDIDHVDIGSIGCWGEWNTACCLGELAHQCQARYPTEANQLKITDWYFRYFPRTPLVMLHGGQIKYATARGAGWRADCYGDYGMFGPDWNHMEQGYPHVFQDPIIAEAWKYAPIQLEVCGVIQDWLDRGFDLERILQKGLEWHVSVVNAKSDPIPAVWRPRIDQFLKQLGYRLVLRELTHPVRAAAGGTMLLRSQWDNVGVAPIYRPWPLAYRLRSSSNEVVAQWTSQEDLRRWLPGAPHIVEDLVVVPDNLAEGDYSIDVAILDQAGRAPYVNLAIAGKRPDGWYPISILTIQ